MTFNHHESYICSLAATGHDFDVVVRYGDLNLPWSASSRPRPDNVRLVEFDDQVRQRLLGGGYDVAICHTIKNLLWLFRYRKQRYIFIAHIPLFTNSLLSRYKSAIKKAVFRIFKYTHQIQFVAVSEFKRATWGEEGKVIVLAPEPIDPPPSGQGYDQIAVVCNQLLKRKDELGFSMLEKLLEEFPITVIGSNPGVKNAIIPRDYAHFIQLFRQCRIYLYTIRQPFGDGYNTAMLEAMNMGMAVVTMDNPSSPITHQVNGLVASSDEDMRTCLRTLLGDKELVDRLGAQAQRTIADRFSQEQFIARWRQVLTLVGMNLLPTKRS